MNTRRLASLEKQESLFPNKILLEIRGDAGVRFDRIVLNLVQETLFLVQEVYKPELFKCS